ncbi:hypothetical protein IGI04_002753 [Brassica rapa subsp. trilocularis]|uniref:DUF4283 domain-containing protein n=1 Tax=Brassica rapa subsp. trilocularis TaxID=1813537 RepID=A0ABQ7NWE7_BRACM|nr:hypothetical protein IGI04_002753 [Brassica rapa subsp. trilocularis]
MGSSYRSNSAHMADIKGKGILYEDDDEPIKLTDHDVSQNINEFKLSLIGKILKPKKQSVEKLLQKMPVQWGMEDRITANDLGNGKFLLNFTTEEELNSVLRQGPFHFNFCMFVLVRWEPIVHDDYPWIIPFWTRLIGVPLHLWTENNLREIGSRLGHVHQDTIELIEGRMLLDLDSRRPLKFARKAESPEGDEVTIEIKYEMLFKHCSTCGMLTHEKEYCPSIQRQGVFARVQLQEHRSQQYSKPLVKKEPTALHSKALAGPYLKQSSYATGRHANEERRYALNNPREAHKGHVDRVVRRRDEPSWRKKYGGAREEAKPYDRHIGATWREKKSQSQARHDGNVVRDRLVHVSLDRADGPDDHQRQRASPPPRESAKCVQADCEDPPLQSPVRPSPDQRGLGRTTGTRRIASTIVTPSRGDGLDGNVTKRLKGTPRSQAFDTLTEQDPKPTTENDQVIETLDDMNITEQLDEGLMDSEMLDDDLMGVELAEMEAKCRQGREVRGSDQKSQRLRGRSSRHIKHGYKSSAPLGIQKKKFEILLRGSPQKRSKSDGSSLVIRIEGLGYGILESYAWFEANEVVQAATQDTMNEEPQALWEYSAYGDKKITRRESALHSEVEALRWAMENMLQHSTCQSFGTDCKELIAMVKDPQAWPSFATELERIETLQIWFPDFNITYVPRAHNQTADFLAKTARSFRRELHFVGCSIPVWLPRPPQV